MPYWTYDTDLLNGLPTTAEYNKPDIFIMNSQLYLFYTDNTNPAPTAQAGVPG